MHQNILVPYPIERTKIPTVFPVEKGTIGAAVEHCFDDVCHYDVMFIWGIGVAIAKLDYDTRHWPMVYNDTLVFTLKQVCYS